MRTLLYMISLDGADASEEWGFSNLIVPLIERCAEEIENSEIPTNVAIDVAGALREIFRANEQFYAQQPSV